MDEVPQRWEWPVPPFAWRHLPPPDNDTPQPCGIESQGGAVVQGEMLAFDPTTRTITFRTATSGPAVTLAFSRFRRLTLTTPLRPAPQMPGAPVERVPTARQEREYRLQLNNSTQLLTGRTAGHVETAEGMYLFTPVNEEASMQRVFVPRSAYSLCQFGRSAEEIAASQWVSSPQELLDAIDRQQRMPVLRLGQSLLALGLLTREQLERALSRQPRDLALGEMLLEAGMISRSDLQTALAHKMGYPFVDLTRFPIDPAAVAKLPHRMAVGYKAMPLLVDSNRLIVAVDKPSRVLKLRGLHAFAAMSVVPVLASKSQIIHALDRLSSDVWSLNVSAGAGFFATTI